MNSAIFILMVIGGLGPMEKVELLKKRGISLRKLNIIMFVLAVVISTVLLFAMNRTNSLYKKNHKMTQTLYEWREDAYNLQLASDYLTEQIRCFAVSGDKQYLDNYFEEAEVTKRREIALDNIKRNHEDSPAVRELSEAMSESSHLMKREYYAARLAVEGYGYDLNDYPEVIRLVELSDEDKALSGEEQRYAASRYLFDEEYLTSKRRINDNMTDCLDRLEDEVSKKQAKVSKELETQVFIEHVFTFVLIGIMLGIVILTSILVFRPLRRCVELIRKEREIPLKGAYEVRFLAKNYNLMYYTTKENENKLNYEANHDKLTGLFNRRGYDFFLSNVDMETSSIIILDLDNFKDINDKDIHICSVGKITDSASHYAYYLNDVIKYLKEKNNSDLHTHNSLSDCLKATNKGDAVFFYDDGAYSGKQIVGIFQEYMGIEAGKRVINESHVSVLTPDEREMLKDREIHLLFVVCNSKNHTYIKEEFGKLGLTNIKITYQTDIHESAFDKIENAEQRDLLKAKLGAVGEQLIIKRKSDHGWSMERMKNAALGYNNSQQMVICRENVPTYTVPAFWLDGEVNGIPWKSLFIRIDKPVSAKADSSQDAILNIDKNAMV